MSSLGEKVQNFHEGQMWGEYPYYYHLLLVRSITRRLGGSERAERLALCHDLLEDTPAKYEDIPADLLDSVILLTRDETQGDMSYQEYIRFLTYSGDMDVVVVKLADSLANYSLSVSADSSLVLRYRRSVKALWAAYSRQPLDWEDIDDIVSQSIDDLSEMPSL